MSASTEAQVGIIGAGARTALGRSLPASAAAVRAGIANIGRLRFVGDRRGRGYKVARAAWLPEHLDGAARLLALAENAAKEALVPLLRESGPRGRNARLRVLVGLSEPRPGRPDDLDGTVARAFEKNPRWGDWIDEVAVIPGGHAAAILALEQAAALLRQGEADLCLVGGVDSHLEIATLRWLEEEDRLHAARRPWGFTPGEAAGFCLLASMGWLQEQRVDAPVSLFAVSSADEPARIRTRTVCVGAGLTAAFDGALAPLRATGRRVERLIGDLNGEPYRADELGFALSRTARVRRARRRPRARAVLGRRRRGFRRALRRARVRGRHGRPGDGPHHVDLGELGGRRARRGAPLGAPSERSERGGMSGVSLSRPAAWHAWHHGRRRRPRA